MVVDRRRRQDRAAIVLKEGDEAEAAEVPIGSDALLRFMSQSA